MITWPGLIRPNINLHQIVQKVEEEMSMFTIVFLWFFEM